MGGSAWNSNYIGALSMVRLAGSRLLFSSNCCNENCVMQRRVHCESFSSCKPLCVDEKNPAFVCWREMPLGLSNQMLLSQQASAVVCRACCLVAGGDGIWTATTLVLTDQWQGLLHMIAVVVVAGGGGSLAAICLSNLSTNCESLDVPTLRHRHTRVVGYGGLHS